jgi:hypothetical protein
MNGHMNGVYATGGPITPGDALALEPGPAPYVAPHQLGVQHAHAALPAASPIPVPDPTVHTLPSGHTVTIASPRILTRGQRMKLVQIAHDPLTTGIDSVNAMFTWLITAWSYPFPTPSADPASLDLIPAEDDDELTELVVTPARALLFPKAASPDDVDDEGSPTEPSGE